MENATPPDQAHPPVVLPRLANLPEELISNISIKLGPDDIFAFRLSCRALEQKSFHEFASEYFREKCIIFTSDSLKALVGIAISKKLRGYLHSLYIMPSLFSDRVFNCCQGAACTWKPSVRQSEAWRQYIRDQQELKKSGRDLELLTQAFQGLPALTHVDFVDSVGAVPRHVDLRGLSRAVRATNNNPAHIPSRPSDKEYYKNKNHVWDVIMRALAASGKSTLLHFNTNLDQMKNSLSVSKNFDLGDETASGLATALQKVHLVGLYISSRKQSNLDELEDDGIDRIQGAKNMAKIASILPSLTNLRLCFSYSPSSFRLCSGFLNKTKLHQLRSLRLEKTFFTAKYLGPTMLKMTSLEELFLVAVRLVEGTWKSILKTMQKLENLGHLHLMWLEEQDRLAVFLKPLPTANPADDPMHTHGPLPADPYDDDHIPYSGYDSEEEGSFDHEQFDSDDYVTMDEDEDEDMGEEDECEGHDDSDAKSAATDESMPDLEPGAESAAAAQPPPTSYTTAATSSTAPPPPQASSPPAEAPHDHSDEEADYKGLGTGPDRGQKICLNSVEELKKYLPIFIEEYHCADDEEEAAAAASAMAAVGAGPGNALDLLNMIPLDMLPPMMQGGGGGAMGGMFTGGGGAGGGAGGLFGPPPPPGHSGAGVNSANH